MLKILLMIAPVVFVKYRKGLISQGYIYSTVDLTLLAR